MLKFFSIEKILETITWSIQNDKREKDFEHLFIPSDMF